MDNILYIIKKIVPASCFKRLAPAYHFALALIGAVRYGFPTKSMTVIGVTGTKGKTTTSHLIGTLLNFANRKTGVATTAHFAIGTKLWPNTSKQTMLGRMKLQALLARMRDEGCTYAVVETSSEGILQFRHRFIDYNAAVFTNLAPEHIERHGGFENYRAEKIKLFAKVAKKEDGIGVYNLDDENVAHFLREPIAKKIGVYMKGRRGEQFVADVQESFEISDVALRDGKTEFSLSGIKFEMPLVGEFNVYNAALAIATVHAFGVEMSELQNGLAAATTPRGRFEKISLGQPFSILVDYAHEPSSLEAAYTAVRMAGIVKENKKIIGVFGAQGGGRDVWKRAALGAIAAKFCGEIALVNEDPYDDDPIEILEDIKKGIVGAGFDERRIHLFDDRQKGIEFALRAATAGDAVVITGKGGENSMCVAEGKKIPWSDVSTVEEILGRLGYTKSV